MYTPSSFAESRADVLHDLIDRHPLATIVAATSTGIVAGHIPLMLYPSGDGTAVLRGHIARANPMWKEVSEASEVLAIFQGEHHYISPNWYPSKHDHGKVVPTWNYVVVHARGRIKWTTDKEWLLKALGALAERQERASDAPWKVADAPADYIQSMLGAIVGFEISGVALSGSWKLSQNRTSEDRLGVISGLSALSTERAHQVAALIEGAVPKDVS